MSAPAADPPTVLVVGNPANRRVRGFCASAAALGVPTATIAWTEVARNPAAILRFPDDGRLVRLDAAGEDPQAEALFLQRGLALHQGPHERVELAAIAARRPGQLLGPRQAHDGFLQVLDQLQAAFAQRPSWRVLQPIPTVRTCFDKDQCADQLAAAGLPVPTAVQVADPAGLRAAYRARGRPLWIKLTCGSSASGLGLLRGGERPHLITTLRPTPAGWVNSLRLARLEGEALDRAVGWLLAEGARVEVDQPKPRQDGAFFDLRVLLVAGEPRFTVVRRSPHPITNLHLGGTRGDAQALRARMGEPAWAELVATCRAVGRALPHWHLGIDVLVHADLRGHTVLEVNAFGDLLPGLRAGGLDVYGVELVAALPGLGRGMLHSA